jgi:hypothetical protein
MVKEWPRPTQNKELQMSTSNTFPTTLYETEESWGEYAIMDKELAEKTISELRKIEGWENVSLSDYDTYTHMGDGRYRMDDMKKDVFYLAVPVANNPGEYKLEEI